MSPVLAPERITVLIPTELKSTIKQRSSKENVTMSDWVEDAIALKIKAENKQNALKAIDSLSSLEPVRAPECELSAVDLVREIRESG